MLTHLLLTVAVLSLLTAVLALLLKRQRRNLPTWRELDEKSLKVGGTTKKLEALGQLDAVIIGSGLGGLTVASTLARAGKKVAVLEQHDVAGGSTHTFEDKGYEFDVGIHYMGGQLNQWGSALRMLFAMVSDGQLEWSEGDATYDVALDRSSGQRIPFTKDHAQNERTLLAAFDQPGAAASLRRYKRAAILGRAAATLLFVLKLAPPWVLRLLWPLLSPFWRAFGSKSVKTMLAQCGLDSPATAGLGGALTYLYGDYGEPPSRAPWFLHSLLDNHWEGGSFLPTGGSASVAKTIVAAITRRGGAVFVRAPVSEILLERGVAVGVRCRGVEVRAKAVISDAGFRNTFGCTANTTPAGEARAPPEPNGAGDAPAAAPPPRPPLLPRPAAARQLALLHGAAPAAGGVAEAVGGSVAMVYLFVGLDGSDAELGLPAQNVWSCAGWSHDEQFAAFQRLELPAGSVPRLEEVPVVFLGFASAKDAAWAERHAGKACVTILAPVKHEWFAAWSASRIKNRGAEYKAFKEAWKELLLAHLYQLHPSCRGRVAYADVGSPLSNDYYLNSVEGEVYGLDHLVARYSDLNAQLALHPTTTVPGLYLTGQDVLCAGVASALLSGVITAGRVSYAALLRAAVESVLS